MKNKPVFLIIVILCLSMLGTTTHVLADSAKPLTNTTNIEEIITNYVQEHEESMAGLAVAVFNRESVLYQQHFGYSDIEKKQKVDENTVFEWGSVSKLLVWVSAMQLWEAGKLDLQKDVRDYLGETASKLEYQMPVTMLDLMHHKGGFADDITDIFVRDSTQVADLETVLLNDQPEQIYPPGEVSAYSNWGTALAALVVQKISGMDYSSYVNTHIFQPLDMQHTAIAFDYSDNLWVKEQRQKLMTYDAQAQPLSPEPWYVPLYPAGSVTGTMEDMFTFAQALLPKTGQESALFAKAETLDTFFTPTVLHQATNKPVNAHGLWVLQFQEPVFGHAGNTVGCSSHLLIDPKNGLGMVIMTNQAAEYNFNFEFPQLIFGKNEAATTHATSNYPAGFYVSARTIMSGPYSFYRSQLMPSSTLADYVFAPYSNWSVEENTKYFRLIMPYGDLLRISGPTALASLSILAFFALGAIYALLTLLFGGLIVSRLQKRRTIKAEQIEAAKTLRRWNYLSCSLILLFVSNSLVLISRLINYTPSANLIWQYLLYGLIAVAALMSLLALLRQVLSRKTIRQERAKAVFTIVLLCGLLFTYFYWQLHALWKLS